MDMLKFKCLNKIILKTNYKFKIPMVIKMSKMVWKYRLSNNLLKYGNKVEKCVTIKLRLILAK